LANEFLQQLGQGDQIKDFAHASRLYVGDNFNLAPRQGFLYHVFFELSPEFAAQYGRQQQAEFGMLVKSVDLPKFNIDTKTLNSYNKYNIVQTKVKYDQINISFHDDHADIVRSLWYRYYDQYYRDADLGYSDNKGSIHPMYRQKSKYGLRSQFNWGYTPKNVETQFIHAIRIYSFSNKRFAEYTLINPVITAFRHGQHQAGSSEAMSNEMTVAYESVIYGAGQVSKETVKGFADLHYDHSPSPLTAAGGGTRSILGPGGLADSASTAVNQLGAGNPAAAAFSAYRGYQNLKKTDLKAAAKAELTQFGKDLLRGQNPLNKFFIPTATSIYEYGKSPGNPSGAPSTWAATSNGEGVVATAALAESGTKLSPTGVPIYKKEGIISVVDVEGSGDYDKIAEVDPETGEVTDETTLPDTTPDEQQLEDTPGADVNDNVDEADPDMDQATEQATQDSMPTKSITIQSGDTLSKLAQRYGTTVDYLMLINPDIVDKNKIYAGRPINVPG
jgi:LysM repeat protein